jgi:hypothetical protein
VPDFIFFTDNRPLVSQPLITRFYIA